VSLHDIIPYAELFFYAGGATGVLVIHGFTGSTQSMRPLGQALHRAGFTVSGPRLAGHGISPAAMSMTGARDWVASVETALVTLRQHTRRVFVTGLSMGGTLTLHTAAMHAGEIAGAIPINAVVQIDSPAIATIALSPEAPAMVPGIGSDIKKPGVRELAYAEVPVACFVALHALTNVTHALLPRLTCPVLIVTSREDHIVPPENSDLIEAGVGSARVERLWLDEFYHVATIDNDAALIAERMISFIRSIDI
jgi:carboxylesterase